MELRPYQNQTVLDIRAAWAAGAQNVCSVLPTGSGKCLGKGTPVLMFDGSIRAVENIKTGDRIVGPDSRARKVLSTTSGTEGMYRVSPVKGTPYMVNASHILSLKQTGLKSKPKYPSEYGKGRIVNIPVNEYVGKSKNFKHTHKGWRSGVNWRGEITDTYLPPYLLGLWLGDGNSRCAGITTMDPEIVGFLSNFIKNKGLSLRVESNGSENKSSNYHIVSGWRRKGTVLHSLRVNNLLHNKHIPLAYKTATRADRLALLAGIIDTDGAVCRNGYDIVLKNETLSNDVAFVARSLGFSAYVKPCKKTCTNTGAVGAYYRMAISGDCHTIPVLVQRKKAGKRKQKKSVLVTGINVESIGMGDYYGFEISGDGLFLLGDFTVTHNTVVFGHELMEEPGVSFAIAHRQELIAQMSMALARYGVPHRVQANESMIKWIITLHMRALGRHFYDPHAGCIVVGVRTLINRAEALKNEIKAANLWIIDEAHHIVRKNEWGKAVALFSDNCRGLGVTATAVRSDGKGLGRHADGVMDSLVVGPSGRDMIAAGYLSDYRLFAPLTDMHLDRVPIGSTGDFSKPKLTAEVRKSTITGDVVEQYLKIAPGKLGVTFVTDVQTAGDVAASFNAAGVPAEVVHAKTPDRVRQAAVDALARGDRKQLVNVDIFGEGFDLPAIEVCSMARPTKSYGLYVQQFGRPLRPSPGKDFAIIIDHVGNIERHAARGLPDKPQIWTLDVRERRSAGIKQDAGEPVKTCTKCTAVYEGFRRTCPFCGHVNTPDARASVEQVEGDLYELDPAVLADMRGEIEKIDATTQSVGNKLRFAGAPDIAIMGAMKAHRLRKEAQTNLRHTIALWAGAQREAGVPDYISYKQFYRKFGVDVVGAQALGKKHAIDLTAKILEG